MEGLKSDNKNIKGGGSPTFFGRNTNFCSRDKSSALQEDYQADFNEYKKTNFKIH